MKKNNGAYLTAATLETTDQVIVSLERPPLTGKNFTLHSPALLALLGIVETVPGTSFKRWKSHNHNKP